MKKIGMMAVAVALASMGVGGASAGAQGSTADSTLRRGPMQIDTAGVISRSDIVLGQPNKAALEALPLGNGRLGVAVWSENGFTAQLNRADTMPYRYSTGHVVIPGLAVLTSATDYTGRLALYDGAFKERGGDMTAIAYVQPKSDTLIVDVTGADPSKPQTAILKLWKPRKPHAAVRGAVGTLAESWLDNLNPGASGLTFGSLSAITAEGRNVSAVVTDPETITVTFTPNADGRFRILVASPNYQDEMAGSAQALSMKALADRDAEAHETWWHEFWHHADILKVSSTDGSGEYMENLRAIYLFGSAAENGGEYPGSQAGVGDLFSAVEDSHQWDPSAFWHWNLRMQVAANLGAGLPELNAPYFRLYRENLVAMEVWTRKHMQGAPGVCIPETMRFNGMGIEHENWVNGGNGASGWNCDAASTPYYNARTLSTGAEVSLWIWQQYLATGDMKFLSANFPVMVASAQFLLAYEKPGEDGLLHTSPSNAHETQWDVTDPTTDLAARQALYTATIEAAALLDREPQLVAQMRAAVKKIPPLPRVSIKNPKVLFASRDNARGEDMIAASYRPGAEIHNVENIGLEPVWPYDLIGDTSPMFALARRTYEARPNKGGIEWSFDPVQAARLGLGDEVRTMLMNTTQANQHYINGFAKWGGDGKEFYVEQTGIVALSLQEALVQDYDGVIRIAPAVPVGWDMEGSVSVRNGTKVYVQLRGGKVSAFDLEVPAAQTLRVKNPWPNEALKVVDAASGDVVTDHLRSPIVEFSAREKGIYRIVREREKDVSGFSPVTGKPAGSFKKLGAVQIGLDSASGRP